jgi:sulfonate transport system substrate-binding protein
MKAAWVLNDLPYRLDWSQFPAAAPVLEALNADAVDVSLAGDAPTTFALAAGLRAHIIAPVRTSGAGTAIMVQKDSPIHTVADLKGRSIAVNRGSIGHALVLQLAAAQGWSASDYTLVNLLPAEAKTALTSGAVDSWCSWGVYVAQAKLIDGMRVIIDGRNGLMTGLSYASASDSAIAAKRAALMDFCRRLSVARRWAVTHKSDYARVLAAEIGVSEAVAQLMLDTEIPVPVAIDDHVIADEQRVADLYLSSRIIHTRVDARTVFDPSFNVTLSG